MGCVNTKPPKSVIPDNFAKISEKPNNDGKLVVQPIQKANDPMLVVLEQVKRNLAFAVQLSNFSKKTVPEGHARPVLDLPALAKALEKNKSVFELYLAYNRLSEADVKLICRPLCKHPSVSKLALAGNDLGPESVRTLIGTLEANARINYLDLSHNRIKDEGALSLAQYLARDSPIASRLSLEAEPATVETPLGAKRKPPVPASLTMLNINHCGLTDAGVRVLAAALRANSTLEVISLSGNKFSAQGGALLADAIEANMRLQDVPLTQTKTALQDSIRIRRSVRRNKKRAELVPVKSAFLLGCRPRLGGKPNTADLYKHFVTNRHFQKSLVEGVFSYLEG